MRSEIIRQYLYDLRKISKYDNEFIDILVIGNRKDEDGTIIASQITKLISERYAKSKKNQT